MGPRTDEVPAQHGPVQTSTAPATPAAPATQTPSSRRSRGAARAARTPGELEHPPSAQVQALALDVLDDALGVALSGSAVAPFAVVDDGEVRVRRFTGEHAPALAAARAWVAESGAARAAVAWTGGLDHRDRLAAEVLDDNGADAAARAGITPAVVVEAGDGGVPTLVVAHRFVAHDSAPNPVPVGEPVLLGQGAPLLAGSRRTA